jgi:hypothetical protein
LWNAGDRHALDEPLLGDDGHPDVGRIGTRHRGLGGDVGADVHRVGHFRQPDGEAM